MNVGPEGRSAPVDVRFTDLDQLVSWPGMLGYLNFSTGKPDARFQKQLNDADRFLGEQGVAEPWKVLHELLRDQLAALRAGGGSAFQDVTQVEAVLDLVFAQALPAYGRHHADLLFHLSERDLFQPFFLARVCEAVLAQGGPWTESERIVSGALARLNDFVGHRPIAILETRPKGEPYDHERVRPIPLFLRGAGVVHGRYHDVLTQALQILASTDPGVLAEAYFDPNLLDELAIDPRAYDHGHPVNRRPNYLFGEWDPHHIDNQGRYRRFIVRQVTLDAMMERVERVGPSPSSSDGPANRTEALFEAAAVLAGVILMASATSGSGPSAHDSTITLATLMPRIAQNRDAFYAQLLKKTQGTLGERLRREAAAIRQPFGAARQHLNQTLARHRAAQQQHRHLALLFAKMGYPEASRQEAERIPVASVRLLSNILGQLSTGQLLADRGELGAAAQLLPEVEDRLRRGIACGAIVDPWNILGFQGLFPLFAAREDSVQDSRVDELIALMEQIFHLYGRVLSEGAAAGEKQLVEDVLPGMRRLAAWWDRFATTTVGDVPHVHGAEAASSAEHVATALDRWHERGEATADLTFWRQHLDNFRSPKAFALVVEALLRKHDFRAGMALLMNWLVQAEQVPLEDDSQHSFHTLALRWMLGVTSPDFPFPVPAARFALVKKFFDYLEANAEDFWQVPALELSTVGGEEDEEEDEPDELYGAAYEEMTYQDSTDDDQESSVAEPGPPLQEFDLEAEDDRVEKRLRFLSNLARLWQIAARCVQQLPADDEHTPALNQWLAAAREKEQQLLTLLDAVNAYPVPKPLGTIETLIEYDRQRVLKEELLYAAINTCLATTMAVGALRGALGGERQGTSGSPAWEPPAMRIEQALFQGDPALARSALPSFLTSFNDEPLLLTTLADGGQPRQILRVRIAQTILRALAANLPRLGLLRETGVLLKTARAMEQSHPAQGRGVTEFNHLFQAAFQAVVETVVDSTSSWTPAPATDRQLAEVLEALTEPFLKLWIDHSRTLQISTLETLRNEEDWRLLREFIQRYGGDLFHAKFLTLGNLRGILHRGVGDYLDYLRDHPDPLHPVRLIDDLDQGTLREEAQKHLHFILLALVENYEEYKDYNTTTTQSDYGGNLHMLLDFLRLKASYDRHAWQFRPLVLAHEVLARNGRNGAAILWQEEFTKLTRPLAEKQMQDLVNLERSHGMRLATVADRLQERFIKPLALDRLCAAIGPAMREVRHPDGGAAFARLEEELRGYTATPVGVGLDVPHWLRRLEQEVQRVWAEHPAIVDLAEKQFRIPRVVVTYEDLRRQLAEWERPLLEG